MVIAELGGAGDPFAGAGIPVLAVRPLDVAASEAVLDRVVPALAGEARDRLLAGAAGNPLALTELATAAPPGGMTAGQLSVSDLLRTFMTRAAELPAAARLLLFAASADGIAAWASCAPRPRHCMTGRWLRGRRGHSGCPLALTGGFRSPGTRR